MNEVQDATQIIVATLRIGEEVFKVPMKIGAGIGNTLNVLATAILSKTHEKPKTGEVRITELLRREPGDMEVFKFPEEHLKELRKALKKYQILYCSLPDLNKKDGYAEIMFPVSATPRINAIVRKLGYGKIVSLQDYAENAVPEEVAALQPEGREAGAENIKNLAEIYRISEYQNLIKNPEKIQIEVMPHMITSDEEYVKIKVPGEKNLYMRLLNEDLYSLGNGSYLAFLDRKGEYKLSNMHGRLISKKSGSDLALDNFMPYQKEFYRRPGLADRREELLQALAGLDQEEDVPNLENDVNLHEYQRHAADPSRVCIEVTPQSMMEDRGTEIVVRVPGQQQYVCIDKAGMYPLGNGDFLMFLSKEKNYQVYDVTSDSHISITGSQLMNPYAEAQANMYRTAGELQEREEMLARLSPAVVERSKWDFVISSPEILEGNIITQEDHVATYPQYPIEISKEKIFGIDGERFSGFGDKNSPEIIRTGKNYRVMLDIETYIDLPGQPSEDQNKLICTIQENKTYQLKHVNGGEIESETVQGKTILSKYFAFDFETLTSEFTGKVDLNRQLNMTEEIGINKKMVFKVDDKRFIGYGDPKSEVTIPEGNVYMTRIPYHKTDFLILEKDAPKHISNNGKTLFATIKKDEMYRVFDSQKNKTFDMKGDVLYKNYEKLMKYQAAKRNTKKDIR